MRFTVLEGQRQDPHTDQIRPVDALKRRGDNGFHTEQIGSFCSPVSGRTGPVLAACENDFRCGDLCGVVDRHDLAGLVIQCVAALGARRHLVSDTDIGKGTTHHDLVISTATSERIEIPSVNATLGQPLPCGTGSREGASWRDVVGGDGIGQFEQHLGSLDGLNGFWRGRQPAEEGGQPNVC